MATIALSRGGRPRGTNTPKLNPASPFYKGCKLWFCLNGQPYNSIWNTPLEIRQNGGFRPQTPGLDPKAPPYDGRAFNGLAANASTLIDTATGSVQPVVGTTLVGVTIVGRIFPRSSSTFGAMCIWGNNAGGGLGVGMQSDTALYFSAGGSNDSSNVGPGLFHWWDVVAVYAPGVRKVVWINGRSYAQTTRSGAATTTDIFSIGETNDRAGAFNGLIADVGVWTYAWPDALVRSWYKPQLRQQFYATNRPLVIVADTPAATFNPVWGVQANYVYPGPM